jgi:uracil-DNA glycosylase
MTRRKEMVGAVVELARRAGVSCVVEPTGGGHFAALLTYNGRTRKVVVSASPSDRNAQWQVKRDARRVLRELGAAA